MDDEIFFEAVVLELEQHGPRKGLWAKAFATTRGNSEAARALYIELRAKQLREESVRLAEEERKASQQQAKMERQRQELAEREARSKCREYDALLALAQMMRRVGFSEPETRERLVNRDVDGFIADTITASVFRKGP